MFFFVCSRVFVIVVVWNMFVKSFPLKYIFPITHQMETRRKHLHQKELDGNCIEFELKKCIKPFWWWSDFARRTVTPSKWLVCWLCVTLLLAPSSIFYLPFDNRSHNPNQHFFLVAFFCSYILNVWVCINFSPYSQMQ